MHDNLVRQLGSKMKQFLRFSKNNFHSLFTSLFFLILMFGGPISSAKADRLLIGGTGASTGVMKLLATAYMKKRPDQRIVVLRSLGSRGGIKALTDMKIDLALSSRPLKEHEKKNNFKILKYAASPLVLVTRKDNEVCSTTTGELIKLYSGQSKKWKTGQPVRVIRRPIAESDIKILQSISSKMKSTLSIVMQLSHLPLAFNDQENADMIERLPGSLGAISLAQLKSENRVLKTISLNGTVANLENLKNGSYPYYKNFYFISPEQQSPALKSFLDFVFSQQGRTILIENGHLLFNEKVV